MSSDKILLYVVGFALLGYCVVGLLKQYIQNRAMNKVLKEEKPETKPETKPEKKKLYIPEDKIEEVYALWDAWDAEKVYGRYLFWKRIFELFPEAKGGNWEFMCEDEIMKPYIVECE